MWILHHIIATTICDYNNQGLYGFEILKFYDISMIFQYFPEKK
jgi:hypothetical protein